MKLPEVVSPEEWQDARARLLVKEKEATRARDALAAERRRLPLVRFDKDYLVVYHFMFEAGGEPCDGCSMFVDTIGHLAHLHARDTSMALVDWEDSPEGYPQTPRYAWWRLHDEYDD